MSETRRYADVVHDVLQLSDRSVRLIGVDGLGGAGKTTFASRLSTHANNCPVIHTDDFAEHDVLMERWPRILHEVIEPLTAGTPATFRRYDWVARSLTEPTTIEPAPIVVIEGVGATRKAWREQLALRVWIETPRDERLRRGLERDGAELADFWREWMAAEDAYVEHEHPERAADLVVDGTASESSDDAFVVVSERQRGEARPS
jgi:uridine kinase